MKKQLIAISLTSALTATSALAEQSEAIKEKSLVGFGGGAVAGGIVGGPAGIVIGAALGALIGENEHNKEYQGELSKQISEAEQTNSQLLSKVARLQNRNQALNQRIEIAQEGLLTLEKLAQLKLNLQFKSNSTDIESFYHDQIEHLAFLIKQNPELKISLSGFADRNGENDFNQELSQKRVETVRNMLIERGVPETSIATAAFGESRPMQAQQNYQNDFYDRRVEISFQDDRALAANN